MAGAARAMTREKAVDTHSDFSLVATHDCESRHCCEWAERDRREANPTMRRSERALSHLGVLTLGNFSARGDSSTPLYFSLVEGHTTSVCHGPGGPAALLYLRVQRGDTDHTSSPPEPPKRSRSRRAQLYECKEGTPITLHHPQSLSSVRAGDASNIESVRDMYRKNSIDRLVNTARHYTGTPYMECLRDMYHMDIVAVVIADILQSTAVKLVKHLLVCLSASPFRVPVEQVLNEDAALVLGAVL